MLKLHVYCTIIFTVTVIFNLLCPSHLHESVTDLNNISCNTSVRIFGLNFKRLVNNEKSPRCEYLLLWRASHGRHAKATYGSCTLHGTGTRTETRNNGFPIMLWTVQNIQEQEQATIVFYCAHSGPGHCPNPSLSPMQCVFAINHIFPLLVLKLG